MRKLHKHQLMVLAVMVLAGCVFIASSMAIAARYGAVVLMVTSILSLAMANTLCNYMIFVAVFKMKCTRKGL